MLKHDQFLCDEFIRMSDDRRFKIDSSGYSSENISHGSKRVVNVRTDKKERTFRDVQERGVIGTTIL